MHSGESSGTVMANSIDLRFSRRTPSGQSRSVHAMPTPPQERATNRNARSQYPAIGASSRLVDNLSFPICRGTDTAVPLFAAFDCTRNLRAYYDPFFTAKTQ